MKSSMNRRVYLDWNATAPLRATARTAVLAALDVLGNPSSVHDEGRAARRLIEAARANVAALLGAEAKDVIFTSGGTEANGLALTPAITVAGDKTPRDRLLVSGIEHPSVRAGGRFPAAMAEELSVTGGGLVDLAHLAQRLAALKASGICRPLVSIMHANNETGVVQPVAAAAQIVHATGGLLHVDAVQSAGRIPCNIKVLGADLVTLSAHKLGGPKGVGALIIGGTAMHISNPLIKGGGQERGARAGTENVAGIAGFGAAAEAAAQDIVTAGDRMAALRERLEHEVAAISPDAVIFGRSAERLPNTTLFAVPGIKAETALIALDLDGIAVSSGAACSSGKVTASHVLAAMGVDAALARGALRVSLGAATTEHEIDVFLKAWIKLTKSLSKRAKERRGLAA
jgi:cysteine desulfurase